MIKDKKTLIKFIGIVLINIVLYMGIYNNFYLYKDTIAKVESVNGQQLTASILNGDDKGERIILTNDYEDSLVYDDNYKKGNLLFVSYSEISNSWTIIGMKRDHIIALVLLILINLLIIFGTKQGLYTVIGLIFNILVFTLAIYLYSKGLSILPLSIVMVILFSCLILFLINGKNRNTLLCIFSTLSSVFFIGVLSTIIIYFSPDIPYDFTEFMPEPHTKGEANLLLISEILIGGLGVIMDISVTITTCASELIAKDKNIKLKSLLNSCKKVADDITGTMINVVLLTNIAAFMPIFILAINNGFRISTIINNNMYFETIRFLTGSIGIIIAIPLSIFIVSKFNERSKSI